MIDTNDNTIFHLAALVLQAVAGDYTKFVQLIKSDRLVLSFSYSDEAAINIIKRICVLPKRVIDRNITRRYW